MLPFKYFGLQFLDRVLQKELKILCGALPPITSHHRACDKMPFSLCFRLLDNWMVAEAWEQDCKSNLEESYEACMVD